jgi:hypothetical protein
VTAFVLKPKNARMGLPGTKNLVNARIHPNLMRSYAPKISVQTVYHETLKTAAALIIVRHSNVVTRQDWTALAILLIHHFVRTIVHQTRI